MWRLGIFTVVTIIIEFCSSADIEYGNELQRLKRSPHYCPPYFYSPHYPRYYPPPPPPPQFWPPPPPPPPPPSWPPPPPPPPPPSWPPQPPSWLPEQENSQLSQPYTSADSNISNNLPKNNVPESTEAAPPKNEPCDICDKNQSAAISKAESVSGTAVAIAIARSKEKV